MLLLQTIFTVLFLSLGVNSQRQACSKGELFAYDFENCTNFFQCLGPLAHQMACPLDLVFSVEEGECVLRSDPRAKDCLLKSINPKDVTDGFRLIGSLIGMEHKMLGDDVTLNTDHNSPQKDKPSEHWAKEKEGSNSYKMPDVMEKELKKAAKESDTPGKNMEVEKLERVLNQINGTKGVEMFLNELDAFVEMKTAKKTKDTVGAPHPDPHCGQGEEIVAHEMYCHRYYNCSEPHRDDLNRYLKPYEYECPYPQLFSQESMICQDFNAVQCGERKEYLDACQYAENLCSGPHCKPCNMIHGSCVGLPDGFNRWQGRERFEFYVECRGQRKVGQGNCATLDSDVMHVFSSRHRKCVPYSDAIEEVCKWSKSKLPHPYQCHLFFDCGINPDDNKEPEENVNFIRICPYPLLYSVNDRRCEKPEDVICGSRREAKTPCDYMPTECVDPGYASCEGLPDGQNVFRTREGTPHYVVCEKERTIEKGMCETDDRGIFKQFSPGVGKCMAV